MRHSLAGRKQVWNARVNEAPWFGMSFFKATDKSPSANSSDEKLTRLPPPVSANTRRGRRASEMSVSSYHRRGIGAPVFFAPARTESTTPNGAGGDRPRLFGTWGASKSPLANSSDEKPTRKPPVSDTTKRSWRASEVSVSSNHRRGLRTPIAFAQTRGRNATPNNASDIIGVFGGWGRDRESEAIGLRRNESHTSGSSGETGESEDTDEIGGRGRPPVTNANIGAYPLAHSRTRSEPIVAKASAGHAAYTAYTAAPISVPSKALDPISRRPSVNARQTSAPIVSSKPSPTIVPSKPGPSPAKLSTATLPAPPVPSKSSPISTSSSAPPPQPSPTTKPAQIRKVSISAQPPVMISPPPSISPAPLNRSGSEKSSPSRPSPVISRNSSTSSRAAPGQAGPTAPPYVRPSLARQPTTTNMPAVYIPSTASSVVADSGREGRSSPYYYAAAGSSVTRPPVSGSGATARRMAAVTATGRSTSGQSRSRERGGGGGSGVGRTAYTNSGPVPRQGRSRDRGADAGWV
jgi:hypothetical protein